MWQVEHSMSQELQTCSDSAPAAARRTLPDHPSNPLTMPDFAPLASGDAELQFKPPGQPQPRAKQREQQSAFVPVGVQGHLSGGEELSSSLNLLKLLGYSSSADEQDYMTFRYRWGRLAATGAFVACAVAALATPLGLDRQNWFKWWSFYGMVICGVLLFTVAGVNVGIVFYFRNESRVTLRAARLYEMCIVCGGLLLCLVASLYYYNTMMCAQDKLSFGKDPSACYTRIPIGTLMCTVTFTCIAPCRAVIGVVIGSILSPLATFIVRLAEPLDGGSDLATKLIVTLVITGAFTYLCIKRDLAHRKRYQIERVVAAGNAKMAATQALVVDTVETLFPPGLVGRLVRGMTVVSASNNVAVGVCDIGDLSTMSRFLSPLQIITLLNQLTNAFEAAVQHGGGEKLRTFGDRFAFTVGLLTAEAASPPSEVVPAAIRVAYYFMRKHSQHPVALALGRASFPLRTCIGFGACAGGVVGITIMSYEVFSPSLTEIDGFLPDCPANVVVITDAAAVHCPSLVAREPLLTLTSSSASSRGIAPERRIVLFRAFPPSPRDAALTSPSVISGGASNTFNLSVGDASSTSSYYRAAAGATERRRQAELAAAIFKWATELKLQAPHFNDPIEQVKDTMLDRALAILRDTPRNADARPSAIQDPPLVSVPIGDVPELDDAHELSEGVNNYVQEVQQLLDLSKKRLGSGDETTELNQAGAIGKGVIIPRRYACDELEEVYEDFERAVVVTNAFVLFCIVGVFFAALLVVILVEGGSETRQSPTIPMLGAGVILCAALAIVTRCMKLRLTGQHKFVLNALPFLQTVLMVFAFVSVAVSRMRMLTENTMYILILHIGLISSCTTRFSHAVLLGLVNAAGNTIVMWNSHDFSTPVVIVYGIVSFTCTFPPLEMERGLRSSFELVLAASAQRRGLRDNLAVAAAIMHRTLPDFVASRVLHRGQAIAEMLTMIPNVFVTAMRIDGFSRSVCDGMQHNVESATISVADEFICHVELCITNAVRDSLAHEEVESSVTSLGDFPIRQPPDILVKVSAFGDKMVLFGPLVEGEKATDRELRIAARAMLHAVEHLHGLVEEKYSPGCVATSIGTFDSGLVAIVGKSRCVPNIMGVAARQADLLLRAAPDGYKGVVSSFVKAVTMLELKLPVVNSEWVAAEQGESWRVRGAGAVTVHKLQPRPL